MASKNAPVSPPVVPLELCRALYRAAAAYQEMAPWQWMDDAHVFGVTNEHGTRLLSVLGGMGELFGLVSYRGSTGASYLLRLLNGQAAPEDPNGIFYQDALLTDFVPLKGLDKVDRAVIKEIDFKAAASKPKLYPEFCSHKPGYAPWYLNESEAHLVLEDLKKAVRFAELFRTMPGLYDDRKPNEFPFLPATETGPLLPGQLEWRVIFADPPPDDPIVNPQDFDLAALMKLPQAFKGVWEVTAFYALMPISQPPRPYYPKLALAADANSGALLGFQLSGPEETIAQAAAKGVVHAIQTVGCRPATIRSDSLPLVNALQPLAAALGSKIVHVRSIPAATEARQFLESFNGQP